MTSEQSVPAELRARWNDLASRAARDNRPCFSRFTPAEDQIPAQKIAERQGVLCEAYGGAPNTTRVMLCFTPFIVDPEVYPIRRLTATWYGDADLNHRDFLGSLIGCDVQRETIGDILIDLPRHMVQVFVVETVAPVLLEAWTMVGGTPISCTDTQPLCLTPGATLQPIRGTVASLRADAVLALALHLSREKAAELIKKGQVVRYHAPITQPNASIEPGDVLSVRGYGKYRIAEVGGTTRKGRIQITVQKYA